MDKASTLVRKKKIKTKRKQNVMKKKLRNGESKHIFQALQEVIVVLYIGLVSKQNWINFSKEYYGLIELCTNHFIIVVHQLGQKGKKIKSITALQVTAPDSKNNALKLKNKNKKRIKTRDCELMMLL